EQIEAMLAANDPAPEPEKPAQPESESTGGMLTQEQIEAMLAANDPAPEPEKPAEPEPEPTGGKLTQEQIEAMLAANNPAPEPEKPAEPEPEPTGGKLTQEQIEAMLAANDPAPEPEKPAEPEAEESAEPEENIASEVSESEMAAAETAAAAEKTPAVLEGATAAMNIESIVPAENTKKEKKPFDLKRFISKAIPIAAATAACAAGFLAALLLNTDLIRSDSENFAIKSANLYNTFLPVNTELCVYRAYVRKGVLTDECMLYTLSEYRGEKTEKICRFSVDHDAPDNFNLYYILDEGDPGYIAMKNSSDPEDRIKASLLRNYSEQTKAADTEIRSGDEKWEKIDCSKINAHITSDQKTS
ncbi:MAG: hypothetical protein J6X60_01955, partial [Ruminiclostridium sp.]|nr:hypothetical protein [Ruminiclostridium sp.]